MNNPICRMYKIFAVIVSISAWPGSAIAQHTAAAQSKWIKQVGTGTLEYTHTAKGDRIIDFSYAGYKGGGVRIPAIPSRVTIYPVAGDNTAHIQRVIDSVSQMPLQDGFRGAIVLAPGSYSCSQTIRLAGNGIVLRGSGEASKIIMTGAPHVCFSIGEDVKTERVGKAAFITDTYVPSGAHQFTVTDGGDFSAGDEIAISKPVTGSWVRFMGMDALVRDGKKQTWITGELVTERTIQAVKNNVITITVPLTDSYDAGFTAPGTTVQKIRRTGEIQNVGLENLSIIAPEQSVTISQPHHSAIRVKGVADGWLCNLSISNTVNSIAVSGRRITVDNINIQHAASTIGAAKPADLSANGGQLLFNKCTIRGDNVFFLATGAKVNGPNVLLNCTFSGNGWIQPHQRWATGLLIDGCKVPDGGIDFMNRGEMGSGHGWSVGWAVAWNCVARSYLNQQPPGAFNWVIGSSGEQQQKAMPFDKEPFLPEGVYDSHNKPVVPLSLYLQQLKQRLGAGALENIGY